MLPILTVVAYDFCNRPYLNNIVVSLRDGNDEVVDLYPCADGETNVSREMARNLRPATRIL